MSLTIQNNANRSAARATQTGINPNAFGALRQIDSGYRNKGQVDPGSLGAGRAAIRISTSAEKMSGAGGGLPAMNDKISQLSAQSNTLKEVSGRLLKLGYMSLRANDQSASDTDRVAAREQITVAKEELDRYTSSIDPNGQDAFVGKIKDMLSEKLGNLDLSSNNGTGMATLAFGSARGNLLEQKQTVDAELEAANAQAMIQAEGMDLSAQSAREMSSQVQEQILTQADTAMLAQANAAPQQVLRLLN